MLLVCMCERDSYMGKVEEREEVLGKGGQEIKDSDATGIEGERMSME